MFRSYAVAVRLAYLSALAVVLFLGGWSVVRIASASQPESSTRFALGELIWLGLFVACISCAARALIRPLRREPFLPESCLRERPVVGTLVAIAAALASFLVYNIVLAFLQTWPETGDVNFAGPATLALVMYAFALLTGEIVLVGSSSQPTR